MDYIEKETVLRTIKRKDIIAYFIRINGKETDDGKFEGEGWKAEVGQETGAALGSFQITEVKVLIRCKKELFDRMYSKFCMEFFRAGG